LRRQAHACPIAESADDFPVAQVRRTLFVKAPSGFGRREIRTIGAGHVFTIDQRTIDRGNDEEIGRSRTRASRGQWHCPGCPARGLGARCTRAKDVFLHSDRNNAGPATVQAVEAGSGDDTTITLSAGSDGSQIVQSFQNCNIFELELAKLYLAFSLSGTDVQMYLYNTDQSLVYTPAEEVRVGEDA
jgi:hypothetical protein